MKYLKKLLSSGLATGAALANTIILPNQTRAYPVPTQTYEMVSSNDSPQILSVPDFSSITFRSLGSFSEAGYIWDRYDREAGYSLGRQWQQGDSVIDVLKLGDIATSFGVERLTLKEIVLKSGRQLDGVSLDRFGFLNRQTVAQFVRANPQIQHLPVRDVRPLADLVRQVYGDNSPYLRFQVGKLVGVNEYSNKQSQTIARKAKQENSLSKTINTKIKTFTKKAYRSRTTANTTTVELSQIMMGDNLDLSQYTLEDVVGSDNTYIQDYENWQNTYISEVEAIADISLNDFPNPMTTTLNFISRADMFWGDAENQVKAGYSVSGSNKKGYAVPCDSECAHVELDDLENSGRDLRIAEGKRWVIGRSPGGGAICPDSPWGVDGGHGALGLLNCGKEPTGRNPFGSGFKVSIWDVDEVAETANTVIFFRICGKFTGCSPYFIGPVPWLPIHKGDLVILGPGF